MNKSSFLQLLFLTISLVSVLSSDSDTHQHFIHCLTRFSPNPNSISQVIYTPQNSSYDSVLKFSIHNLRFASPATPKPLVIVTPRQESQVQTVIYCAKKHDIRMRIRGGGHDYEGLSYATKAPFVLLDMKYFCSVSVDHLAATAWVQSGATLGELYYSIAQKSDTLAFPGGIWCTVGVTGLISGGGYGTLRRKYGLAADNVIDARLIDANGRILDRKSMGEDLFWAIRGGGASSFGVILSWKVKLVKVPRIVTGFRVYRTLEQNGTELVHKWQTIAPRLPKEAELRLLINVIWTNKTNGQIKTPQDAEPISGADEKTLRFEFLGSFLGPAEEFVLLMKEKFPELGVVKEDCLKVTYIQMALIFSLFKAQDSPTLLLNRTSYTIPFKAKSSFVNKPIPIEGLEGIWKHLLKQRPTMTNLMLTSYGGRMEEISESAIPFPHRAGTLYMMYMRVTTMGQSTNPADANAMEWIRSLYEYVAPFTANQSAYLNYNDLDLGVNNEYGPTSYEQASAWGKKYFKKNFDRLVRVKSVVDPSNFFRHEQSIPPARP
ncbi:hypothetical protein ACET3Z_031797 [Daucus carota]